MNPPHVSYCFLQAASGGQPTIEIARNLVGLGQIAQKQGDIAEAKVAKGYLNAGPLFSPQFLLYRIISPDVHKQIGTTHGFPLF